jgi:hypothetical protein
MNRINNYGLGRAESVPQGSLSNDFVRGETQGLGEEGSFLFFLVSIIFYLLII